MVNNENLLLSEFNHRFSFVWQASAQGSSTFRNETLSFALMIFAIALAVLLLVLFIFRYLKPRWQAMQEKIQRVCTSGYLPEPPTDADDRTMRKVSRAAVWLQIGKVKWTGLENLNCATPKLIVPTHGHYLDPFVLAARMPKGARVMAAKGLFDAGGGLGGLVFSRWGAFCTDLEPGKGLPALRTAVKILSDDQILGIFPEGWANMDGIVGPFNPGIASIVYLAAKRIDRPVHIVPVYMRYGRYPGKWIKPLPTSIQCLILMFGFLRYRRGLHVIIGRALLSSDLPKDPLLATEQMRNAVLALNPLPSDSSGDK